MMVVPGVPSCLPLRHLAQTVDMQTSLEDCTINGNEAHLYGGGVALFGSASLRVLSSFFSLNKAQFGGGLDADANSKSVFSNATVVGNAASRTGGGLYMIGFAQVPLTVCAVTMHCCNNRTTQPLNTCRT